MVGWTVTNSGRHFYPSAQALAPLERRGECRATLMGAIRLVSISSIKRMQMQKVAYQKVNIIW